ncbi:MAG: hypothetical protein O4859_17060 [Trichodesmium sp. St18_bin1]|nr:hypothetical protein [Trichodesmium sp. St18_bin1]MDE5123487.1 hypothetical protein [Trichodesmium sp. St19_bin1]
MENQKWTRVSEFSQLTPEVIDKILFEKIPLAGSAISARVYESWLHNYVNHKYTELSEQLEVQLKGKGSLKVQMDEWWSFVAHKGSKQ